MDGRPTANLKPQATTPRINGALKVNFRANSIDSRPRTKQYGRNERFTTEFKQNLRIL